MRTIVFTYQACALWSGWLGANHQRSKASMADNSRWGSIRCAAHVASGADCTSGVLVHRVGR
jgi:hypothetical protein